MTEPLDDAGRPDPGSVLSDQDRLCPWCAERVVDDPDRCPSCGTDLRSLPAVPWWHAHPRVAAAFGVVGVAVVLSVLPLRGVGEDVPRQPWMFAGVLLLGGVLLGVLGLAHRAPHRPKLRLVCATAAAVVTGVMARQGVAQLFIARYQDFGGPAWVNSDIARVERGVAFAELVPALLLGWSFIVLRRSTGNGGRVKAGWWSALGVVLSPVALYPVATVVAPIVNAML